MVEGLRVFLFGCKEEMGQTWVYGTRPRADVIKLDAAWETRLTGKIDRFGRFPK